MPKIKSGKGTSDKYKRRHRFFLSPYIEHAFTKCPRCEGKTKVRKFPLVIHIEPKQLFLLNKLCKFCPRCDLIIAKQEEVESLMADRFSQANPEVIGNEYLVVGTLDRNDWREGNKGNITPSEITHRMYVFEEVWNFEILPAGWYPCENK